MQANTLRKTSHMLIGLTIMKVRQMRANIGINGKDPEKRTNEQTNERANGRMEQEFMNEIVSTTREIKENPLFGHKNKLFRQFLENIEDCYQQYFMRKSKGISKLSPMKIRKKRRFLAYFWPVKKFSQKWDSGMFWALRIRIFVQKIGKN